MKQPRGLPLPKRICDLLLTIPALALLAPLFGVIALLIKAGDGGPVFFRQKRVGYRGKPFYLWKFRTMIVPPENKRGIPLTIGADPRITPAGRWLRQTKIDELPQLLNVLRGEMSLVGPRPEVPRYVALYTREQRAVLEIFPGITDPASIRYRRESELLAGSPDPEGTYIDQIMPTKIRLNLDYAAQATVWSDFKVILRTLFHVLRH